jgi:hypothetical protein
LLPWAERQQVIHPLARYNGIEAAEGIDTIFGEAALLRGEHSGAGELWLGPTIPINGLLVRDPTSGLWRPLQFAADSTAPIAYQARGRA